MLLSIKTMVLSQHLLPDGTTQSIAIHTHKYRHTHIMQNNRKTKGSSVAFIEARGKMFCKCAASSPAIYGVTLLCQGLIS